MVKDRRLAVKHPELAVKDPEPAVKSTGRIVKGIGLFGKHPAFVVKHPECMVKDIWLAINHPASASFSPPQKLLTFIHAESGTAISAAFSKLVAGSMLSGNTKLIIIKIIHTLVWIFFNIVIFYLLYAAITNKIDKWLWIGYGLFVLEGIVLLCFRFFCPLTVIARKYSDSTKHNFDIYLPEWLAKHNKLIYTSILGVAILITIYQLVK